MINETFRVECGLDPLWVVCESEEQMISFKEFIASHRGKSDYQFAYWNSRCPIHAYAYVVAPWCTESSGYGIDHLYLKGFPENKEGGREYIRFSDWYSQISLVSEDDRLSNIEDLL